MSWSALSFIFVLHQPSLSHRQYCYSGDQFDETDQAYNISGKSGTYMKQSFFKKTTTQQVRSNLRFIDWVLKNIYQSVHVPANEWTTYRTFYEGKYDFKIHTSATQQFDIYTYKYDMYSPTVFILSTHKTTLDIRWPSTFVIDIKYVVLLSLPIGLKFSDMMYQLATNYTMKKGKVHPRMGTAVAQWLRCCATNWKVAGSIPAGVIGIFHWHKILPIALWPWGRLSLKQRWVPGAFPWGKGGRWVRVTTLPPSCAIVMKPGNLNFLEPSPPLQACNRTALPFFHPRIGHEGPQRE